MVNILRRRGYNFRILFSVTSLVISLQRVDDCPQCLSKYDLVRPVQNLGLWMIPWFR
jgi:hypothetical protein